MSDTPVYDLVRDLTERRKVFNTAIARLCGSDDSADAWDEGDTWAAEECGHKGPFLAPGDNPYRNGDPT